MPDPFFMMTGANLEPVQDICKLSDRCGVVEIVSQGVDPILAFPELSFAPQKLYLLQADASSVDRDWDIYWITEPGEAHNSDRRRRLRVQPLGCEGAVSVILPRGLCRQRLRLDPGACAGESVIRSLKILQLPEVDGHSSLEQSDFSCQAFCRVFCEAIKPMWWNLDRNCQALELGSSSLQAPLRQIASMSGSYSAALSLNDLATSVHPAEGDFDCMYLHMQSLPPLEVKDNALDLVLAPHYFLIANESFAVAWLEEIHRMLKPGALLAVACRQRKFIEECEGSSAKYGAADQSVKSFFGNKEQRLAQYDLGEYIWHPLASRPHPWEGVSAIPNSWIKDLWHDKFLVRANMDMAAFMPYNLILMEKI